MNENPLGSGRITAKLFTDPSCPFGYSANPALRTIEWRYRDQLDWQLVMIGLSEPDGTPMPYTRTELAQSWISLRDSHGMPFSVEPKLRPYTSSRACQAIIAARLIQPGSEWRTLRALQLLHFNSPLMIDDDEQLRAALSSVEGLDADRIVSSLDSREVQDAYRRDWAEARTAAGGPTELQGKSADTPDGVRYTAPSVIFESGSAGLELGGFQPVEAYDVAIANLDPTLVRSSPADSPLDALMLYPSGLTSQEIAAIMAPHNTDADRSATERELIGLLGERKVTRIPMGHDAVWLAA
ncbi:MAG: DsbA family protein [Solirubrobacterales bacterium]